MPVISQRHDSGEIRQSCVNVENATAEGTLQSPIEPGSYAFDPDGLSSLRASTRIRF